MYVLIVIAIMANSHPGFTMQEFSSQKSCEAAAHVIRNAADRDVPQTFCVPK